MLGVMLLIVASLAGMVWDMQANHLHDIEGKIDGISKNLLQLEIRSRNEGWEKYSGWRYQLDCNRLVLRKLGVPVEEWPRIPNHLKEEPLRREP